MDWLWLGIGVVFGGLCGAVGGWLMWHKRRTVACKICDGTKVVRLYGSVQDMLDDVPCEVAPCEICGGDSDG